MKSTFAFAFFLVLGFLARCYNFLFVFIGGQVYFTDGDCYSRMTRVRMVMAHPFHVIRHQYFENYPQGIASHATAPFDYLIALLALLLKPFTEDYIDVAGALVSPLLGVAMLAFLWEWARAANLPYRGMMMWIAAFSPIIVHGAELGRPAHHSLQMLCVVVALGAEWCFSQKPSRGWGIASGAAWGMGLWVSLYEPLVLLVLTAILHLIFDRKKLWAKERRAGYIVLGVIIVLMLLIDGLPFELPYKVLVEYFPRWEKTISEMSRISITDLNPFRVYAVGNTPVIFGWVGFGLLAAPVLLILRYRKDKRALVVLAMVIAVLILTLWQSRWGYFFGIVFAMSVPLQFALFRKWWVAWGVFGLALVPVWWGWRDGMLYGNVQEQMAERKSENLALRVAAEYLRSDEVLPVLAPWWFCPQIAYWSGQPTVAGTSHEGLQGIVDTSRFYMATDPAAALAILQAHGVRRVIGYDSDRVLDTSSVLLNETPDRDKSMAAVLYRSPHSAPPFLVYETGNSDFKIFQVAPDIPRQ